jgi:hypothetical protein
MPRSRFAFQDRVAAPRCLSWSSTEQINRQPASAIDSKTYVLRWRGRVPQNGSRSPVSAQVLTKGWDS